MTAHERVDRLLAELIQQASSPGFLRPSEIEAKLEDEIRQAVLSEREDCAQIAGLDQHWRSNTPSAAAAIRQRPAV